MEKLIYDPKAFVAPVVTLSEGFTLVDFSNGNFVDSTGQMIIDSVKSLDGLLEYLDKIEENCQTFDLEGAEWYGPKNGEGFLRFYVSWEPNPDDPSHFGYQTAYHEEHCSFLKPQRWFETAISLVQVSGISLEAARELVAYYSPTAFQKLRAFETSVVNEEGVRWVE